MPRPIIHWFRQDLRVGDNAALAAAVDAGGPVLPVFILDESTSAPWPLGGAVRWWLHHSLTSLECDLRGLGAALLIRRGDVVETLAALAEATGAVAIHWNRVYEPGEAAIGERLRRRLADRVELRSFAGRLLFEPEAIRSASGRPLQVFTPFWSACLRSPEPGRLIPPPPRLAAPPTRLESVPTSQLRLRPVAPDWSSGLAAAWTPGEAGAQRRLGDFLGDAGSRYRAGRNSPGVAGTSRLSPHLRFGEVSPRQIWHSVRAAMAVGQVPEVEGTAYLRQLGWREFSAHLLVHWPELPARPLRGEFASFPWAADPELLAAWRHGRTGYPIVDAGMRELWTTGWMHNRVRMIVASFLVKDLLVPWQTGEAWFWDTLVDADLANNAAGWQWVAGCGADASPYFRIFNPVLQGRKFDPDGDYVRRWVPELDAFPTAHIHAPWLAPAGVAAAAGVALGVDYPLPIIDHGAARQRALDAYAAIRTARPGSAAPG